MTQTAKRARLWWVPWAFVGGFVVVLVANGALVYFAFDSWTGVATEDAYAKGLAYNEEIGDARAQESRGWRVTLDFTSDGPQRGKLDLDLKDRFGTPITGARVAARLVRPTHEGHDLEVELTERGGGRYAAELELPLAGQWSSPPAGLLFVVMFVAVMVSMGVSCVSMCPSCARR